MVSDSTLAILRIITTDGMIRTITILTFMIHTTGDITRDIILTGIHHQSAGASGTSGLTLRGAASDLTTGTTIGGMISGLPIIHITIIIMIIIAGIPQDITDPGMKHPDMILIQITAMNQEGEYKTIILRGMSEIMTVLTLRTE